MTTRRFLCRAAPFILAVSTGCASGGPGSSGVCTSNLPPDSVSISAMFDSVATSRAIMDAWRPPTGRVLGSLRFDSTGVFDSSQVYTASLPRETQAELRRVLNRAVESSGAASPERRAVRLFLGDEAGPALRGVRQFRTCAPRIRDEARLVAGMLAEAPSLRLPPGVTVTTQLQVFVLTDGTVDSVRVAESSGNTLADLAAGRVFRSARFTPARIEGIPRAVWVRFPVNFRGQNRTRGRTPFANAQSPASADFELR